MFKNILVVIVFVLFFNGCASKQIIKIQKTSPTIILIDRVELSNISKQNRNGLLKIILKQKIQIDYYIKEINIIKDFNDER